MKIIDIIINRIFVIKSIFFKVIRLRIRQYKNSSWNKISVIIIPVIKKDISSLKLSIDAIVNVQKYKNEIHLIIRSEEKEYFQSFLENRQVRLINEEDILDKDELKLRGWLKQQLIKLKYASSLVDFEFVLWMDSDLVWIMEESIFDEIGNPIYRYSDENHVLYKKGLLELGLRPYWCRSFITHYMVVEPKVCRRMLDKILLGSNLPDKLCEVARRNFGMFSEYDLYATFALRTNIKYSYQYWNVKNSTIQSLPLHERNCSQWSRLNYTAIAYHNYGS